MRVPTLSRSAHLGASAAFRAPITLSLAGFALVAATLLAGDMPRSSTTPIRPIDNGDVLTRYSDGYVLGDAPIASAPMIAAYLDAEPLSLASGDFDEDGVDDLVGGYKTDTGGIVSHRSGNVAGRFPELKKSFAKHAFNRDTITPFSATTSLFEAGQPPDFLEPGDFDDDGHLDLVVARREAASLSWLKGRGDGTFERPRDIPLEGKITAMSSGDFGWQDGLADIAVGVSDGTRHLLQIWQGQRGALKQEPWRVELDATVTDVDIGQLDRETPYDVVAVSGRDLHLVYGPPTRSPASREELRSRTLTLPQPTVQAALGDFIGTDAPDIAVLLRTGSVALLDLEHEKYRLGDVIVQDARATQMNTTKTAATGKKDLVFLDRVDSSVLVLHEGHFEQFVDAGVEDRVDLPVPSFGPTRLELAAPPVAAHWARLNSDGLRDVAVLLGNVHDRRASHSIAYAVTLPRATFVVNDPGNTHDVNPGDGQCVDAAGMCTYHAAVDEANALPGADRIEFAVDSSGATPIIRSTVEVVGGSPRPFVYSVPFVEGGGSRAGNLRVGFGGLGMHGTDSFAENIWGGVNAAGTRFIKATSMLSINGGSGNVVDAAPGEVNVFASVNIIGGTNNRISNSYIGLTPDGGDVFGSDQSGDNFGIQIGGGATNTRFENTVISGFDVYGVLIRGHSLAPVSGTTFKQVFVGTDPTGGALIGAGNTGFRLENQVGTLIAESVIATGKDAPVPGNGIETREVCEDFTIENSRIGTDAGGEIVLGNRGAGILVQDCIGVRVGGASAGNVISGNLIGMQLLNSTDIVVEENLIGTDVSGLVALGNDDTGMIVEEGRISGNVVAANGRQGIQLRFGVFEIVGNFIGTDRSGTLDFGNEIYGISTSTTGIGPIGGLFPGDGNVIAFNKQAGIRTGSTAAFPIRGNSIYANGGHGILAGSSGHPRPDLSLTPQGLVRVQYSGSPGLEYHIDFYGNPECHPNDLGEGRRFLTTITVSSDAQGAVDFEQPIDVAEGLQFVTATAVDATSGATSRFSNCVEVTPSLRITLQPERLFIAAGSELVDVAEVVVDNFASDPLTLTELNLSHESLMISSGPTLPIVIPARGSAILPVTFDPSGGAFFGSMAVKGNRSGNDIEGTVSIATGVIHSIDAGGVAIDPTNPEPDVSPPQSAFREIGIVADGFEAVDDIFIDPITSARTENLLAVTGALVFDLVVEHSVSPRDVDIVMSSASDGYRVNVTEHLGPKFLITSGTTTFNQAIDARELPDPYTDLLVSNKAGAVRFQFGDSRRLDERYVGALVVNGDEDAISLSTSLYTPRATYTRDDVLVGHDYSSASMPALPVAGESSYQIRLIRCVPGVEPCEPGINIHGPAIRRSARASRTLRVLGVSYTIEAMGGEKISPIGDESLASALDLLKKIYPISEDRLFYETPSSLQRRVLQLDVEEKQHPEKGQLKILTQASQERLKVELREQFIRSNVEATQRGQPRYHAIVAFIGDRMLNEDIDNDGMIDDNTAGLAFGGGPWIALASAENIQGVVAHEIGHRISTAMRLSMSASERLGFGGRNLGDEYDGGSYNCGVNPPVKENTKPDGSPGCPNSPLETGIHGDDVGTFTNLSAFDPTTSTPLLSDLDVSPQILNYNFMSASGADERIWASHRGYRLLYDNLIPTEDSSPKSLATSRAPVAHIAGFIRQDDSATLDRIILDNQDGGELSASGPFVLEIRDASESVILSHAFDVSFIVDSEPAKFADAVDFGFTLDWPTEAARVVLLKNGVELASRPVSPNAPVVHSVSGEMAGDASGDVILNWSASDADGDPLTYTILYVPDDKRVIPIATALDQTTYRWPPGAFAASTQPRVVVVASDGVNDGRGEVVLGFSVVSIDADDPSGVEVIDRLDARNYPNPFSKSTTIEIDIPDNRRGNRVRVDVFDVLGRLVTRLLDRTLEPGTQHVTWDGRGSNGAQVPSGLYIYVVSSSDDRVTKAVTVVR